MLIPPGQLVRLVVKSTTVNFALSIARLGVALRSPAFWKLLFWFTAASALRADVPCFDHRTSDCSTALAWDNVALDNVTIEVGNDVLPGRYSAGVNAINGAG